MRGHTGKWFRATGEIRVLDLIQDIENKKGRPPNPLRTRRGKIVVLDLYVKAQDGPKTEVSNLVAESAK